MLPAISVDSKKKELIGNFRADGKSWCKDAIQVDEYRFASTAECVATPYGVYDIGANKGYVYVGTSVNSPAFAVTAVTRWVAVQILNWKPGQAQVWGSDISRGWTRKPRQARVTVKC